MRKIRSYAVLVSIAASAGLLTACGDDDADNVSDTGVVTEAPVTQAPPATSPSPSASDTPAATPPPAASDTLRESGSGDDSATDITPEPDSR